jgi:hypothetical protein
MVWQHSCLYVSLSLYLYHSARVAVCFEPQNKKEYLNFRYGIFWYIRTDPQSTFKATRYYDNHWLIFQYISKKMQRYTVYLYLEIALHVSGSTSTHHQERIQLYLQHLVFVILLLLPAAIAASSSNAVKNTRCCRYSYMRSWWWVEVPP